MATNGDAVIHAGVITAEHVGGGHRDRGAAELAAWRVVQHHGGTVERETASDVERDLNGNLRDCNK